MIVLRAPKTSYFWLGVKVAFCVVGAFLALGLSLLSFFVSGEGWSTRDPWDWFNVAFALLMGCLGLFSSIYPYYMSHVSRKTVRLVTATPRTLSLKCSGEPAIRYRPEDLVGVTADGTLLIHRDGTRVSLEVSGATRRDHEAFVRDLYALWWPELSLEEVRTYLRQFPSLFSPRRFLIFLCVQVVLLTAVFVVAIVTAKYSLSWVTCGLLAGILLFWVINRPKRPKTPAVEAWYPFENYELEENW